MSKNSDGGPTFNVDVTNVVDSNIPPTILRQTLLRDQLIHRLLGLLPESYIPHEHMRETFGTAIRKVGMQQALTEPEAQMLLSLCGGLDSDHAYFRDLKEALIKLVRGIRLKGIAPHIDSHLKGPDKAEDDLDLLLKLFKDGVEYANEDRERAYAFNTENPGARWRVHDGNIEVINPEKGVRELRELKIEETITTKDQSGHDEEIFILSRAPEKEPSENVSTSEESAPEEAASETKDERRHVLGFHGRDGDIVLSPVFGPVPLAGSADGKNAMYAMDAQCEWVTFLGDTDDKLGETIIRTKGMPLPKKQFEAAEGVSYLPTDEGEWINLTHPLQSRSKNLPPMIPAGPVVEDEKLGRLVQMKIPHEDLDKEVLRTFDLTQMQLGLATFPREATEIVMTADTYFVCSAPDPQRNDKYDVYNILTGEKLLESVALHELELQQDGVKVNDTAVSLFVSGTSGTEEGSDSWNAYVVNDDGGVTPLWSSPRAKSASSVPSPKTYAQGNHESTVLFEETISKGPGSRIAAALGHDPLKVRIGAGDILQKKRAKK